MVRDRDGGHAAEHGVRECVHLSREDWRVDDGGEREEDQRDVGVFRDEGGVGRPVMGSTRSSLAERSFTFRNRKGPI